MPQNSFYIQLTTPLQPYKYLIKYELWRRTIYVHNCYFWDILWMQTDFDMHFTDKISEDLRQESKQKKITFTIAKKYFFLAFDQSLAE